MHQKCVDLSIGKNEEYKKIRKIRKDENKNASDKWRGKSVECAW